MSKLSTTTLTSFLFSFLISVPSSSVSAADKSLGITDAECFSTALKQHWSFWDAYLECPKYLMFLEKKIFLEKISRQTIREANMNYFKTGKLVYPGAWRALFWHAFLMLSIVTSSYSNGTKSLGHCRECFMVVRFGSVLSLCTNSSLILVFLTPFFSRSKNT